MFNVLFTGRLNRKQYICRCFAAIIIAIIASTAVMYASGMTLDQSAENIAKAKSLPMYLISAIATVDSVVFYVSSALSFLFFIYLCAAKGMPKANQYEPQP